MTRSPRYVLPTHLCRFAVRARTRLPRGFSRDLGLTRFAQSLRPEPRPQCGPDFPGPRAALHHGDVQNPAEPPPSVAPSVVAPRARCRNVCLLRVGYAYRPRLSPRLTLGGLASPRKPWVFGGDVCTSLVVTHAYIFFSGRSSMARAIPSAPTGMLPYHGMTSMPSSASATVLMPDHHPRGSARPVSCYALFE